MSTVSTSAPGHRAPGAAQAGASNQTGSVVMDDGCTIAYRLDGDVDAPPLLLSNSLGTAMAMWDPQIEALAATHRVLRYDSRGHGRSAAPPGDYTIDRLGLDALSLLDHLAIDRADFCGLSLGGMVGQWIACHRPDRIRRLVLANTSALMAPASAWQSRMDLVGRDGMAAIAEAVITRWFTPAFLAKEHAIAPVRAQLLATAPQGYIGCCAAIRDMDQRATAPLIAAPALVIGGTDDPATPPEHAHFLADAIPGAKLAMLPAAHLSNIECPEAFTRTVERFLTNLH